MMGLSLLVANHTVEYWLPMDIDPIADEPLDAYLSNVQLQWQERIRVMSPWAALLFANADLKFSFRMRYQRNVLRVWFTPEKVAASGVKSLA
jgi:hypothetical protein